MVLPSGCLLPTQGCGWALPLSMALWTTCWPVLSCEEGAVLCVTHHVINVGATIALRSNRH